MLNHISEYILDIFQNCIFACATLVEITISQKNDVIEIIIADNGKGIPKEKLDLVLSPFYTTKKVRKTGLGIPLFKESAVLTGGSFEIKSNENGTEIFAVYNLNSPDCPMLGNLKEDLAVCILAENPIDIIFQFNSNCKSLKFDTRNINENDIQKQRFIYSFFEKNEQSIKLDSYGENFFRQGGKNED